MLRRCALERRLHADGDVSRLVEEAENRGVSGLFLLGPREREPRFSSNSAPTA